MSKRLSLNSVTMLTEIGGFARLLINKTGTTSVKGTVLAVDTTQDLSFILLPVNGVDVMGICYGDEAGNQVADGVACFVVFSGFAHVLFGAATTRGHMARMTITADTPDAAGTAISEAYPTAPFATDKHFGELGHVFETIGGAGLAMCEIHKN